MGRMEINGLSVFYDGTDSELIRPYPWNVIRTARHRTNYVVAQGIGPSGVRETIYMHRLIMGLWRGDKSCVDHIDKNGLNNYRHNLRIVTSSGNSCNRRKIAGTTSKYKGVSFNKRPGLSHPWTAAVKHYGKKKRGYYKTELEAAMSYNEMAIEVFGPYAHLNDIGPYS